MRGGEYLEITGSEKSVGFSFHSIALGLKKYDSRNKKYLIIY